MTVHAVIEAWDGGVGVTLFTGRVAAERHVIGLALTCGDDAWEEAITGLADHESQFECATEFFRESPNYTADITEEEVYEDTAFNYQRFEMPTV